MARRIPHQPVARALLALLMAQPAAAAATGPRSVLASYSFEDTVATGPDTLAIQMEKDGIALWLGTREGRLVHVSDGIPKKLFAVEAFVWYAVDVAYEVAAVLALAGLKRFGAADERLALLADGRDDPRYAVASAYVGLARGDLDQAEAWLRDPAGQALDRDAAFRDWVHGTLVAEQYYYVQLWKGRYDVARDYALRMGERLRRAGLPSRGALDLF